MSRVVHFEILADDPEALAAFYKDALDWSIRTWDGPQKYWLATTGHEGTAGINGGIMERHFQQPVINTVHTDSLDETIEKVKAAGGTVQHGPNEIPGVGMHAYCADPQGNWFGLLEPGEHAEPAKSTETVEMD